MLNFSFGCWVPFVHARVEKDVLKVWLWAFDQSQTVERWQDAKGERGDPTRDVAITVYGMRLFVIIDSLTSVHCTFSVYKAGKDPMTLLLCFFQASLLLLFYLVEHIHVNIMGWARGANTTETALPVCTRGCLETVASTQTIQCNHVYQGSTPTVFFWKTSNTVFLKFWPPFSVSLLKLVFKICILNFLSGFFFCNPWSLVFFWVMWCNIDRK